jgi:photosystem II stability/assembly factor-like uncharacterized protein
MRLRFTFAALLVASSLFAQAPALFSPRGIGGGGALFSPSFNPGNTSEYFVSCDMSELFHTTSSGLAYDQIHFTEFNGGHNSKVCYTALSGTRYSISYINDIGTPVVSADGGNTWNLITGNPDANEDVYTIHSDYLNAQRIIISQYGAIFFSSNGGTSFTQIHTAATGQGNVVAGVFFDGNNIYIGTNDGVLVSTNGGGNWSTATLTGIPAGEVIWSFCAAKSGNTTRFFCLTGDPNDVYVGLQGSDYWGFFRNVYTCDYGTTNWTAASNGITLNTDFPMFIDMAENDINTVYVSGSNDINEPIVMKSINAGGNWAHVFNANNNQNIVTGWSGDGGDRGWSYGECPFGFDVCSSDANYLIFSDFGFVHISSNGGTGWNQGYVDIADDHPAGANTPQGASYHSIGIENTTCWQTHWIDANNMWACYSDIRGIRSTDAGLSWSFNYANHTANSSYRVAQMSNGTMIMACSGIHDMYQSTRLQDTQLDATDTPGTIRYSTNNGASWTLLHSFGHPVFWIALDPNNTNRAYASVIHYNGGAGVGGVYRCDDLNLLAGSTWTLLSDPPGTEKHPACIVVLNDGTLVATYSGRRNASGTFTNSSGVFTYNPTSGNWTDVSDPGMSYWTKDIVVDPNDPTQNTWYVGVFSGWGGPPNGLGGLYKTTNRGTTWNRLTGTTLDRVTSCTFDPNDPNSIYVTTETQGLWYSGDINNANPTFSLVNSYPFRQPERVFFNPYDNTKMWVTSFGNGMKVGDLSLSIADFSREEFNVYPNPASESFTINGKNGDVMEILSINGAVVRSQTLREGVNVIWISDLNSGVYIVRRGDTSTRLVIHH